MEINKEKGYFDPLYLASRKKVTKEFRELAEQPLPTPEKDWGVVWPLVGPELTFGKHAPITPEEQHKTVPYNQTERRFETAINIAKQVTALRLNKDVKDVTMADIEQTGPTLYWNGRPAHNDFLNKFIADGELEESYNFPASKIVITANREIENTNDQFDDFPTDMLPPEQKVIIITDLYHLPRVERHAQKHVDKLPPKLPPEKRILYPSQPSSLPVKIALQEIRKIHGYSKQGFLPPEQ